METPRASCLGSYLGLRQRSGSFALLGQEEAHGHQELVDAAAELLFMLPAGGQGEQPPGLDDVLENIFLRLEPTF